MPNTIVVYGNPIDGLQFVGPFTDEGEAADFAERYLDGYDWWLSTLQSIETVQVVRDL